MSGAFAASVIRQEQQLCFLAHLAPCIQQHALPWLLNAAIRLLALVRC